MQQIRLGTRILHVLWWFAIAAGCLQIVVWGVSLNADRLRLIAEQEQKKQEQQHVETLILSQFICHLAPPPKLQTFTVRHVGLTGRGQGMQRFLKSKSLNPLIPQELFVAIENPIVFTVQNDRLSRLLLHNLNPTWQIIAPCPTIKINRGIPAHGDGRLTFSRRGCG